MEKEIAEAVKVMDLKIERYPRLSRWAQSNYLNSRELFLAGIWKRDVV